MHRALIFREGVSSGPLPWTFDSPKFWMTAAAQTTPEHQIGLDNISSNIIAFYRYIYLSYMLTGK